MGKNSKKKGQKTPEREEGKKSSVKQAQLG